MSDPRPGLTRWVVCGACGAAAELLAVHPRCTRPGCRWHDRRAEEVYAEECPTPVPWRAWEAVQDDGA